MTADIVQPTQRRKWYEIWWDIWSNHSEASFLALLNEPDHSITRGFIWIAVVSFIVAIMTGVTSTQTLRSFQPGITNNLVYFICTIILSPIFGIIGLVISTGIYHGLARLVGGKGTWSDLVICMSAVIAASELIGGVVGLITILLINLPGAFFLPGIIAFVFGIYGIILSIIALKAVEKIGTGQAILAYLIPVIIIGLLVLCAFLTLVPAIRSLALPGYWLVDRLADIRHNRHIGRCCNPPVPIIQKLFTQLFQIKEVFMFRKFFVLGLLFVMLFVASTPASAISYGTFDGTDHPNVGSMVAKVGDDYYQWCSGTLISDRVFLTASHCTAPIDSFLEANPGAEMLVTFDPTISSTSTYYTGVWHTNPAYFTAHGEDDPGDVAVIVLDQAPGISPASLPTAGLLDQLKAQHILNDTTFTAVGYGTVRTTNHQAWQAILDNVDRNRADQGFLSLTNAWLTLSMNLATGNGGTCYGDSGGPHFIHLDGAETDIVAAVTVTGDANCKATDKDYRVDTPAARSFLSEFVTLP